MNLQRLFMLATIVAGHGAVALGVVGAGCSSPPPPPASSADGAAVVAEPTARAEEPVRAGSTLWTLQKIAHVDPVYPPEALAAHTEGVVPVEVTIGADGRVENARIVRSIPLLDQAALDAVTQWRFEPLRLRDGPTAVKSTVTVSFTLPRGVTPRARRAPK